MQVTLCRFIATKANGVLSDITRISLVWIDLMFLHSHQFPPLNVQALIPADLQSGRRLLEKTTRGDYKRRLQEETTKQPAIECSASLFSLTELTAAPAWQIANIFSIMFPVRSDRSSASLLPFWSRSIKLQLQPFK